MRNFLLLNFILFITSFAQGNKPQSNAEEKEEKKVLPPVIVIAGKPTVVAIPTKPGGSYIKKYEDGRTLEIKLLPPVTTQLPVVSRTIYGKAMPDQSASALGLFTTYTTDNGLPVDAIHSSILDKAGNLWFCFHTWGDGVSRYDGKSFTNFTTVQGLVNNAVNCITEDKTGNLWFGTFGGVSRYDGKSFTNFTTAQGLANNIVYRITEDKTGNLWFGTFNGLSRYDGKSFANFTTVEGMPYFYYNCITEDKKGNIWFYTSEGVSRYDGKSNTNFTKAHGLAGIGVGSITEDKTGNLWFCTSKGVSRYDGKSFTKFTMAEGMANNIVRSIAKDKTGNLWFFTSEGISHYDGKSFTNFTTVQGLMNNIATDITEDKTGNLWFRTSDGVSRYDGKSFTNFNKTQGLAHNGVGSITEDKAGNLWFGTSNGLSLYEGKSFTNFTKEQGFVSNQVLSISEDKMGNLWFGTNGDGVCRYDGKSFTNFTTAQGMSGASCAIQSITEDKMGNLWFGTFGGGVSRYDGNRVDAIERGDKITQGTQQDLKKINEKLVKSFTNFTTAQGLPDFNVNCITEDEMENLWFGTYNGVSCYDGKFFTNFTTAQGLANDTIICSTLDKTGNLWFGTTKGVSRFDGKFFFNYTTAEGLANNVVFCITEDKMGNLWFGTGGGLSCLNSPHSPKGRQEKAFITYTTADGLPDNQVTQLVEGNGGKLYIGTKFGICELIPIVSGRIRVGLIYNSATGYPVKRVNGGQNAMYKDRKGIIWIGTNAIKTGLVRFDPSALNKNPNPPTVILQSIKINEKNICWYNLGLNKYDSSTIAQQEVMTYGKVLSNEVRDSIREKFSDIKFDSITKFYPLPVNLVLPYKHNSVTFSFVAIELSRNFLVRYQYKLESYDKEWSPLSDKTNVSFGHIYEGAYTFKLKAQRPDGIWSEPITYIFKVLPPWYRSWWAYGFYAVTFILVLTIFIKWRVKAGKEKAEMQNKITDSRLRAINAQMNPHFIFNCMQSIQNFIRNKDVQNADAYLLKFASLIRKVLDNSTQKEISLADDLETLENYVELEKLRLDYPLIYKVTVADDVNAEDIFIPPLLIQPFVENAIKHGLQGKNAQGEINIEIKRSGNQIEIIITDNGIGRQNKPDVASERKSYGIPLTQERLNYLSASNKIKAIYDISDAYDAEGKVNGTTVFLKMPVA